MPLLEGRVSPELEIWSEGGCAHVLKKGVRTLPPTYRCASVRAWLLKLERQPHEKKQGRL